MDFIEQSEFLPRIEKIYSELQAELIKILPNSRVEHIGSSSIPGTISKGDLDIFVGVDQCDFKSSVALISKIGFHQKADTLQTKSLCMMITNSYSEDVAIQVVANGSEFESFLDFRDKLRSNPELIVKYNQLKFNCKGMAQDMYREIKSSFIESVLNAP